MGERTAAEASPAGPRRGKAATRGARGGKAKQTPRGRGRWRRPAGWLAVFLLILLALPLVLIAVYRFVPPVSTLMLAGWLAGEPVRREWVALEDVAPVLVRAVISSEDNFFCRHHGVDFGALREALESEGGPSRGASTIAMQVARNLFLWQGRSYVRKALELPLAAYADLVLGKRRMMEVYLNIAEWGPGIYGVGAAARHHFGVAARDLTLRQAALLAVALPNPAARDPARPNRRMTVLAAIITRRTVATGADLSCIEPEA